jgi:hypothetical protein
MPRPWKTAREGFRLSGVMDGVLLGVGERTGVWPDVRVDRSYQESILDLVGTYRRFLDQQIARDPVLHVES